ncbi:Cc8K15.2-like protein [Daphnia magna]|uniref:Cc8K15.2-like protein n=1 Tax=Daphnia magna TaxID=35525 RepID=A0A164H7T9_9CRUS|nr:Cc8K15.2-like protein [Daphnia magna]
MQRVLRSHCHHWLVGTTICEILGSKLPTNELILKRYLFLRDNSCGPATSTIRVLAKIIYDEIISRFWERSRIPTKPEKACLDQLVKLVKTYENLKKIPNNRLNSLKSQQQIQKFVDTLKCLLKSLTLMPTVCWKYLVTAGQSLETQRGELIGIFYLGNARYHRKAVWMELTKF